MSTLLFGRRASVRVERKGQGIPASTPGDVTGQTPLELGLNLAAVVPSGGLRIQFKIEKHPLLAPNTADISITNLSDGTRRQMKDFGAETELRAGYRAQEPQLPILFRGQARTIDHVRKGSEWTTRIQCGDGEIPFRFADVAASFKPGIATKDVVSSMADRLKGLGVDTSAFASQLGSVLFPLPQFVKGYATQGNALQEIQKLLGPGYLVSIQSGELRLLDSRNPSSKEAVVLSPSSGLLGSPEHSSPDRNGLPSVLKVKALLLPHLEPGDPFILQGVSIKGTFRAETVSHTGDTHGGDWSTDIEAWEL